MSAISNNKRSTTAERNKLCVCVFVCFIFYVSKVLKSEHGTKIGRNNWWLCFLALCDPLFSRTVALWSDLVRKMDPSFHFYIISLTWISHRRLHLDNFSFWFELPAPPDYVVQQETPNGVSRSHSFTCDKCFLISNELIHSDVSYWTRPPSYLVHCCDALHNS